MFDTAAKSKTPTATTVVPNARTAGIQRVDPVSGTLIIFAPKRDERPNEFRLQSITERSDCPFCSGAESKTPPTVWAGKLGDDQSQGSHSFTVCHGEQASDFADWAVRVVENKYPAVVSNDSVGAVSPGRGLFQQTAISGAHEVIIESSRHNGSLTDLDLSEVVLTFMAYRDRIQFWSDDPSVRHISVFKNVGEQAGASLTHSHSQLIALDCLPPSTQLMLQRFQQHRAKTGCCLHCDLIRDESESQTRVIAKVGDLVAYCPFASRMPMLVRITSQTHQSRFDALEQSDIESLSRMVQRIVSWLEKLHPGVSYNLLLHTQPPQEGFAEDAYHWSIEIFPRLTHLAGFEFSSDCIINPVMPETAAQRFRECAAAEDPRVVTSIPGR